MVLANQLCTTPRLLSIMLCLWPYVRGAWNISFRSVELEPLSPLILVLRAVFLLKSMLAEVDAPINPPQRALVSFIIE